MQTPYIIEANDLEKMLGKDDLRVVDLSKPETYIQTHIPAAVHLDYALIVAIDKPVMGLLPEKAHLQKILKTVAIEPDTYVVAYDDEGGGRAARLMWTLASMGHEKMSLLNGGLHAWNNEGHATESGKVEITSAVDYEFTQDDSVIATRQYILDHLNDEQVAILDTRSAEEFSGAKRFAERGGHIPGAVNLDWLLLMDQSKNLRLKSPEDLRLMLGSLDVTADKEVVVYCQTHHRSALTFIALKSLGYAKVRGYPGSWSEWGNLPDSPVEN